MRVRAWMIGLTLAMGCTSSSDTGGDALLLAVLPYTGIWESKGLLHENAVRMAMEDLIAAGIQDAYGGTMKVVTVNSGDGIDVVEAAVRDVIEGPNGDKVLGILSSTGDAHEGSARVAVDLGVPHYEISNGAADNEFLDPEQWGDQLEYLLSARALCNYEALYTAQFIAAQYPGARVALLRGNEVHDKMHTAVIRSELAALGFNGTVLESDDPALDGEPDPGNRQDFEISYDDLNYGGVVGPLTDLVAEHTPDVVFFHVRGDGPNLRFLQDAQRAGYDGGIVTCGMARTAGIIDPTENGLISDYLVGHDAGIAQDRFHFVMRGAIPSPRLDAFKAEYEARFAIPPDAFTPAAYDATTVWALGVLAARDLDRGLVLESLISSSRDGQLGSRDDLASLIDAVANGEDVDYDGVSGPMDLRDDRSVPGYYFIERVIQSADTYTYEKLADPEPVVF